MRAALRYINFGALCLGFLEVSQDFAVYRDDVFVKFSLPLLDGTTWRVKAVGPEGIDWSMQVYAICVLK